MSQQKSKSDNKPFDRSKAILKAVQQVQKNLNSEQKENLELLLQNYGKEIVDTEK